MKKIPLALTLLSTLLFSQYALATDTSHTTQNPTYELDGKAVLGRTENVYLSSVQGLKDVPFIGKIDTGAETTSMHAEDIHVKSTNADYKNLKDKELMAALTEDLLNNSDVDYDDWNGSTFAKYEAVVSFKVQNPRTGDMVLIEAPLERVSMIRSRTSSTPLLRPTVKMSLTIADQELKTDVNLTDRSHFSAPVLIGKTFLADNALVFAGYDYLQEQENATVVGRKEVVSISGMAMNATFSLKNRYSILHSKNIDVDKKNNEVTFDMVDNDGKQKEMTLPLVRMLSVSGKKRPLVYVPVQLDENITKDVLVYLRDRSSSESQLRFGTSTASELFMIDTNAENILSEGSESFSDVAKKSEPLIISPEEDITLDGFPMKAVASFTVNTPLLKVDSFEMTGKGKDASVEFFLIDANGEQQKVIKKIIKKLRVGDDVRPVVSGEFLGAGKVRQQEFAIDVLNSNEKESYFVLGKKMAKDGVYVNTRSDYLLKSEPLFKVGHIEVVEVNGMTFPAKLDTGADVSSMNAVNIKRFKKDGQDMVSFTYQNNQGDKQDFTKPVIDVMRIKAKKGEKVNIRPVVEMKVKLGDLEKEVRVNLQDRSRFEYSMILGKNFLKHGAVVSSNEDYLLGEMD
ncbi:ATP-dependent zinc protease [Vibrio cyclitrophicus]|uniref:ATP-dependent zinc protease family protein n=1 Tax=Vibrio cyclitrophicus TaxID=47951 RepID=UPI000C83A052|nr:RimK/LysX family protein [Vibrio cyclitrophicus]MCC4775871.1 RimK/LysX family protein [Vibrio cyclitrophicus]MCC4843698.1 RimK/LysX family protein [Vibrio cyclitrophicus]PME08828.1 peptidase [Vibrio cyclitrophicus]PME58334.1 peptidase [Vibrio cyclitrophicus]PME80125.1 peptidase [Vibrio cyclitrophicus]